MRTIALLPFAVYMSWAAPASVFSAGYQTPVVVVAPGQVITFYVAGIGASLSGPVRTNTAPWPTTLAGISAAFGQLEPGTALPMLSVQPIATCADNTQPGCTHFTAITVQMPFEMNPDGGIPTGTFPPPGHVRFAENGTTVASIDVLPYADQIHILRNCDVIFPNHTVLACQPRVTHANGATVTNEAPAQAGEEIVIYAVGLGGPIGVVPTGQAPSLPFPIAVGLRFDFSPNAGSARPSINRNNGVFLPAISPVFSGMIPGFVGLYQINVIVPVPPAGMTPCASSVYRATGVDSNLTISIGGATSFDGVGICVQPGS